MGELTNVMCGYTVLAANSFFLDACAHFDDGRITSVHTSSNGGDETLLQ